MPVLRARYADCATAVTASDGATLREALEPFGVRLRIGCTGNGSCGLCRVRVLSGRVSAPTEEEQASLGPGLLASGVRLACQARASGEVELEIVNLAAEGAWHDIPPERLTGLPTTPHAGLKPGAAVLGLALDVGTTNLCFSLWDSRRGARQAARRGPNPQARFGADVVARLQAARDPASARELAGLVERAVAEALSADLAGDSAEPLRVLAVGNTAMLRLLHGSGGNLLEPASWGAASSWRPGPLRWRLFDDREAMVEVVPPLGGFVGSDLLAAVHAAWLCDREAPALLLDFGTNTEIALWDGDTLWVTSAAGGPAFEASGVRCAVPADPGAIFRVRRGSPFAFEVLGGGPPTGVCGSGLVDWFACLRADGNLSSRGSFSRDQLPALGPPELGITLSRRDVDLFQRAKAAIGAGTRLLAERAGVRTRDLRRVVATGLFGRALDVASAQAIGLLPTVPRERVEAFDNLALAGCEALLLSEKGAEDVERIRARARLVNLVQCPDFEDAFLAGLHLSPQGDAP